MAAAGELWTVGRLLAWTTHYLQRHHSLSPRLEAELLLAHVLGCPRIGLYTAYGDEVGPQQRQAFKELVRRRAQGEPVAYLVGHKEFYSLDFLVTPDVLIPRPETECLVEAVLDLVRQEERERAAWRILDVGTGSGVVAVCVAKFIPTARVTAVDISPAALRVAQYNAQRHDVADRIEWYESDVVNQLPVTEPFDVVVSNPPYVTEAEYAALPEEIRLYEPRAALVAGPTGTEVIERLLADVPPFVVSGGWLLFEISPMMAQRVQQLAGHSSCWRLHRVIPDLAGHARVVVLQRNHREEPASPRP